LPTKTLLSAFSQLEDPRSCRGIRHPFAGIVVLTLLGMLARIREMEVLVRWATTNWDQLQKPLGFARKKPPCATTISRTLAQCQVGDFQAALATWLRDCLADSETEGVLAVDGKTAKQGLDENGRPLHMLNAFVHDLQSCRWPMVDRCGKNERTHFTASSFGRIARNVPDVAIDHRRRNLRTTSFG